MFCSIMGDNVDDPARTILQGRILDLHGQPLFRIERGQVVEVDLVTDVVRVLEIDLIDLDQGEVALAVTGRADGAVDAVAGAQAEATDLGRRDIDVVGAGQIVGLRAAQVAEAVGQHLERAAAGNLGALFGQGLEDGEHHVLLAHGVRVLDLQAFGEGQEVGGGFFLQLLQRHARHAIGGGLLRGVGGGLSGGLASGLGGFEGGLVGHGCLVTGSDLGRGGPRGHETLCDGDLCGQGLFMRRENRSRRAPVRG